MSDSTKTIQEECYGTCWGAQQRIDELTQYLNEANQRIKQLEEALGLVLKMRNDWLENQEDGYEGAYYAFVKGNDSEWEEIIKSKEDKL